MGQNNRGLPAILRFRAVILSQLHRTASAIWFRHPSTRGQLSATLYKLAKQKWSVIKSALGQNHCGHFKWVSMKTGSPFFDIDFNLCHSVLCWFFKQRWLALTWLASRPTTVRTHTDRCPFSTSCLMTWASCQDTWAMFPPLHSAFIVQTLIVTQLLCIAFIHCGTYIINTIALFSLSAFITQSFDAVWDLKRSMAKCWTNYNSF